MSSPSPVKGIWRRRHHLDRMTLRGLTVAYFQYHAVWAYLACAAAAFAIAHPASPFRLAGAVIAAGQLMR